MSLVLLADDDICFRDSLVAVLGAAGHQFAADPEIPLVVRRINYPRLRKDSEHLPLVVRHPDQSGERNHRETSAEKGGIQSGKKIKMILLQDPDAAERDGNVERRAVEIGQFPARMMNSRAARNVTRI